MTTKLYPHLIRDTEITINIRKVSPFLLNEVSEQFPAPLAPIVTVTIGDEKREERNEADPTYQEALKAHRRLLLQKTQELIVERGVVLTLTPEQKAEVKELRSQFLAMTGNELQGSDKAIYLMKIAIGTEEDLQELVEAITRRSHPTEQEMAKASDSFRGKV